ncbi:MAG: hypothetical protein ACTSUS_05715 [Candidatus Freyarchaeota archaeon]
MGKKKRTKTAPEILKLLAREGPKSKWQMKKATGKSYGNIHETVKTLLDQGLIIKKKTRPSEKNPKMDVEYYDLTLPGLISLLSDVRLWNGVFENDKYDEIDMIIKRNKHLHPLFQKWDHLSRNIQKHELMGALLATVRCIHVEKVQAHVRTNLKDAFTDLFFSLILEPSFYTTIQVDMNGWIKAIKGDDDLRKHILNRLRANKEFYQRSIKVFTKLLEEIKVSDRNSPTPIEEEKGEAANPVVRALDQIWKMRFFYTLGRRLYVKKRDEQLSEGLRRDLSSLSDNILRAQRKVFWSSYFNLGLKYSQRRPKL